MSFDSARRIALATFAIALPVLTVPVGAVSLMPLCALPALFLLAGLMFGAGTPPSDSAQDDDGGGGGLPIPPQPRFGPGGGTPLDWTAQARRRLRDPHRVSLIPPLRRRVQHPPRRVRPRSSARG